jgi:hypothetical protein
MSFTPERLSGDARVVLGLSNVCVKVGHNRHVGYNVLDDSLWDGDGVMGSDTVESVTLS